MAAPTDYIAFYKLENNANDETGNYNGTSSDIVYNGKSAGFNGSSSKLNTNHQFMETGSAYTLSMWVSQSSFSAVHRVFTQYIDGLSDRSFFRIETNGTLLYWNTTLSTFYSTASISDNDFHHIVFVLNTDSISFYIDKIFSNTTTVNPIFGSCDSCIGSAVNGTETHDGNIANVRIYDYVLTSTQISDIYNEEYPKFYNYKDIDSSNGYIEATDTDGYAISQPIVQDTGDTDFASVQNIVGKYELANISIADTADELKTNEPINDGDNLIIAKDDNSVHEIVASGVTGSGPYTMDTTSVTTGEIPTRVFRNDESVFFNNNETAFVSNSYTYDDYVFMLENNLTEDGTDVYVSSVYGEYYGYYAFDNDDTNTMWHSESILPSWITRDTKRNDVILVKAEIMNADPLYNDGERNAKNFIFEGSNNNTTWVILKEYTNYPNSWNETTPEIFTIDAPTSYRYIRFKVTAIQGSGDEYQHYYYIKYYFKDIYLNNTKTFDTTQAPGRSIETKVQMSATGNKMTQLDFDIYKLS